MADGFKLVSTAGDQSIDVKPGVTLVVGRAVNSDIPIYDPTISRQHAQLSAEDGGVRVKDLGSSNGTFLNGSRVSDTLAAPNDVLTFGKVAFYVREHAKPAGQPKEPAGGFAAPKPAGATIVRQLPVGEVSAAIQSPLKRLSGASAAAKPTEEAAPEPTAARSAKKLELLLEISKQLSRQLEVDKLLESVVDFTFQVMDVDRCSILLCEKGSGDLVPRISKSRLGEGAASARHVPQSIARKAVAERVAILTDNAAEDQRFKGKSILLQSVRSAMGAPLMASDGNVLGLIYVDNLTATHAFTDEDLEFLIAFSGVASVAMENSQLSDRIRREALVRANFQRFFSPDVAKQIEEHGEEVKLGGTKRPVVILFSDIRGFTPMSEKMEPDDVAQLLREYFTEMVEIIFRHGGTLDKFIGDAIMALWGAPLAMEDDADKAMAAAIEMQQALTALNKHWEETGKPPVNIGIGINFGEVFAGNIGSEQRLEYTVLGDAVNTASRLCSKAAKGEIMISEPFFKRLKKPPKVESREPIPLKGKSKPVANYLAKY
ncbi:MAG TPA: adenylate/guanylate cyclase domain-containing protein [Gemmatimonadales bacterium]|nr:adenylate/guanylate cyclase domain-containing protein [Gemmatimonadales bacterium]